MYITKTSELENFCNLISNDDFITIDTEFLREVTYYPNLCLIQISNGKLSVIIDALSSNLDLKPLDYILQNKNITKVFHSAKQDLEILYNLYGHLPQNIFDTQIAASFCGYGESVSYEVLVFETLNIKIDKSLRISDWTNRPLTKEQIEYALGDVTHLYHIYIHLLEKLKINNRLQWLNEELEYLNNIQNFTINLEEVWQKIKNLREIKVTLALKKLASWREIKAQKANLPRNHYLNEKHIFKLTTMLPITVKELRKISYFSHVNETIANEIVEIIQDSLKHEIAEELENKHHSTHENRRFLKALPSLKLLLKYKSEKYQLPPQLLATSSELKSLTNEEFDYSKQPKFLSGWRYEIFGKIAMEVKNGTILIKIEDNNIILIPNELKSAP